MNREAPILLFYRYSTGIIILVATDNDAEYLIKAFMLYKITLIFFSPNLKTLCNWHKFHCSTNKCFTKISYNETCINVTLSACLLCIWVEYSTADISTHTEDWYQYHILVLVSVSHTGICFDMGISLAISQTYLYRYPILVAYTSIGVFFKATRIWSHYIKSFIDHCHFSELFFLAPFNHLTLTLTK